MSVRSLFRSPLAPILCALLCTLVIGPVHAATFDGPGLGGGIGAAGGISGVAGGDLPSFIQNTLANILTYVNLAALITIFVAGFYLILGFGDDGAKERAKKIIIYTCIGLLVINFAYLIVAVFASAFAEDFSGEVLTVLERVLNYVTLAAVVVVVTAGFYLILGFGDDGAKERAKKMIIYTAAGLLVIYFADVIVRFFATAAGEDVHGPIVQVMNNVCNYLTLAGVVVIVCAGIYLILGFGDDAAKERAKKMIYFTLAGLLVVLFARVIVLFVISLGENAGG